MGAARISALFLALFLIGCNSEDRYHYDQTCNTPLIEMAVLTATSSMNGRGPQNAILEGESVWSARSNDFDQQLIIDLGSTKTITRIAIQGRPRFPEYVSEFVISYSHNGLDYSDYKEAGGDTKFFKGNTDSESISSNEFEVPIISQWIRIRPTQWRNRISLRAQIYGCDYDADTLYMDGTSLVQWDLTREPISASRESLRMRFKTSLPSGVLLYSQGSHGNFIALQLQDNRLLLNIDLGFGHMTSMSVGSLLDDNVWHDIVISWNDRDVVFSCDRVTFRSRLKGKFSKLDFDRVLYIGGVPNKQDGVLVMQNFTGCMENLYLNSFNIIHEIKETYENNEVLRFTKVNTSYNCPEPTIVPMTFVTQQAHVKLQGNERSGSLNVSLLFRTYESEGLLIWHDFTSTGHIKVYMEEGKVKVEFLSGNNPRILLDNFEETFNDGRWHTLILSASEDSLNLNIDEYTMKSSRIPKIITGALYLIGGGKTGDDSVGFVGCMKLITIDGNYKAPSDCISEEYCCQGEILFNACQITDRCYPNPCEHKGLCRQNSKEFFCDCQNTGYSGAVCHTSIHPLSCLTYKNATSVQRRADTIIDVDGSGPLDAFPVTCEYTSDSRISTVVGHSNEELTSVDGFQEPGSFKQNIIYAASAPQLEALINRSHACRQKLSYACHASRLFGSTAEDQPFQPYAWWVSRHNQQMDYWAGALPGSRKCQCGCLGNCSDPTKWCNCDSVQIGWQEDEGYITQKEYLPVKRLHFGDTGTTLDEKKGRFMLGPLVCEGDDLFDNVLTFRIAETTVDLPPFDMGRSGDIYFEFKTTTENAILIHSKGPEDFIQISISGGDKLQFHYQAGTGSFGVTVKTSYKLSDSKWHSVSVERNRKESKIVVDGSLSSEVRVPPGPVRALQLNSTLVIGASIDRQDGYIGYIRALLLNGRAQDLRGYKEEIETGL